MTGIVKRGDTAPSQHFVGVQVVEAEAFRARCRPTCRGSRWPRSTRR